MVVKSTREASMTKAEIIDCVYEKVGGFSKKESAEVVESVFETMKETLARGDRVKISGFGNFVVREKKRRIGRNPQTGEPIPISARRVLTFKPSQVLKNILNPQKVAARKKALETPAKGSSEAQSAE
jgi:integration host factor subunit alpha